MKWDTFVSCALGFLLGQVLVDAFVIFPGFLTQLKAQQAEIVAIKAALLHIDTSNTNTESTK